MTVTKVGGEQTRLVSRISKVGGGASHGSYRVVASRNLGQETLNLQSDETRIFRCSNASTQRTPGPTCLCVEKAA